MSGPIVVVGGGLSGLTVAEALIAKGQDVKVLEADERPGGPIRTVDEEGFQLENGPQAFLDRDGAIRTLAHRLGLEMSLRPAEPTANRRYVFTRDKLQELPRSPPGFLASPVLPVRARLRALLEPFTLPSNGEDEALGPFMRRHLGDEATAILVDAVQTGTWAGDMEKLSVRAAFPKLWELERTHRSLAVGLWKNRQQPQVQPGPGGTPSGKLATFGGGLQSLINTLAMRLGSRLHTRAQAVALTRVGSGFRVELDSGGALEAAHVVLATPAPVTARILRPLSPGIADSLDAIPYVPVGTVHLGFAPGTAPPLEGFGFLVPHREGRNILGTIFSSSAFPFRAPPGATLLTTMVGGAHRPEQLALSEDALIALVQRELGQMLDLRSEPIVMRAQRFQRGIPQYHVGHRERMQRLHDGVAALGPLSLLGNAYDGVGLSDCVRNGTALAERLAER